MPCLHEQGTYHRNNFGTRRSSGTSAITKINL
ncbi:hypothetical protein T11_6703 [Trichinella zimbabwensis]|uniref:Uncharacterized protein n=1 Tax=Trichinella zimbabwensis TaxID=268475 RepID=A0A0V1GCL7_9BILA|nr:hypothetical protein T11_6703 [Trichinella zimbabwensis]